MAKYSVTFKFTDPEDKAEGFTTVTVLAENDLDAAFRAGLSIGAQSNEPAATLDLTQPEPNAAVSTTEVVHVVNEDL